MSRQDRNELYHFGVKGMKWGIRRYQNYDGTYTKAGQRRHDRYIRSAEKHEEKAQYARTKTMRAFHENQADFKRARISKDAHWEATLAADRYKNRKGRADRLVKKAEKAKKAKNAKKLARLEKKAQKLMARTLKDEEILQTSINTLAKQMDENTKHKVDRWMIENARELSYDYYSNGEYYARIFNPAKYRENINYTDYLSKTANSRRKKPE